MRKNWSTIFWGMIGGVIVALGTAYAHSQITFSNGATLSATDLNTNFTKLFNYDHAMPGSNIQAGTIANAQISASAAIAPTKLATGNGVAKSWADVSGGAGTINESFGVTSVTRTGAGTYNVKVAYTPANTFFAVLLSVKTADRECYSNAYSTGATTFVVNCTDLDTPAAGDADFNFVVFDTF